MASARRWQLQILLGATMFLIVSVGAQAKQIWIAELDGFSFFLNQSFLLTQNDGSVDGTGALEPLNLSYQGDELKILALQDNDWSQAFPFGIGVYPENHPPTSGDETFLVFVPVMSFPAKAGDILSVPIPVPEPALVLVLVVGMLAIVIVRPWRAVTFRREP